MKKLLVNVDIEVEVEDTTDTHSLELNSYDKYLVFNDNLGEIFSTIHSISINSISQRYEIILPIEQLG